MINLIMIVCIYIEGFYLYLLFLFFSDEYGDCLRFFFVVKELKLVIDVFERKLLFVWVYMVFFLFSK